MSWTVNCALFWPVEWSKKHGMTPIPFEGWLAWHYANLLPKGEA